MKNLIQVQPVGNINEIYLVRHGEKQNIDHKSNYERNSRCLTNLGIKQVEALGNKLKNKYPELCDSKYIISSYLARSIQTAEILRRILNINEILPYAEFNELDAVDFNQKYSQGMIEYYRNKALINNEYLPPNGHSFASIIDSATNKILQIQNLNSGKPLIISTHQYFIENIAYRFVQGLREKRLKDNRILEVNMEFGAYSKIKVNSNKILSFEHNIE